MNYLRVKDWAKLQHYSKRRPLWVKSYARLLLDDRFNELGELEQLWLMKLWLVASQSSRFTVDEDAQRVVPVIPNDEKKLRVTIQASRRLPLERFVGEGWLIPVAESALVDEQVAAAVLESLRGSNVSSGLLAAV